MTTRSNVWKIAGFVALLAGCRGADTGPTYYSYPDLGVPTVDLAMTSQGGGGDMATAPQTKNYMQSTVTTMRQGKPGDYELDDVVTIALTPSKGSPRLYVQDAAGGQYSAIVAACSSTSTSHPCSVSSAVAALPSGDSVTLKGTYIRSKSSGFEQFYIDSVTDNGAASTIPAAAQLQLADIERGATKPEDWFQKVTVDIAQADTLKMFDWTPPEFAYTNSKCPHQFGFGMLPASATGNATAACNGTVQPPGQTTVTASEVLIGTDFYDTFTASSDCACTTMFKDKQPTATSTLSGTVSGILVFDVPYMATTGYQYLAPLADADAPITNTQ